MPSTTLFQLRVARARRLVGRQYRFSRLRNAILSIRARGPTERFNFNNRRFVVFLVPGWDIVNGGVMSIFSIASETEKLLGKSGVSVAICTAYNQPRILRYTKFDNNFDILAFADLLPRFPNGAEVLVHLPDMGAQLFGSDCLFAYRTRPDLKWRFNILLQNIDHIPERRVVEKLATLGPVTATTAHKAYATSETARQLGCPVQLLSTWVCPEIYERVEYCRKKKIVMLSPDSHPAKQQIIEEITKALPDHRIFEIRNVPYNRYRKIAKEAKFAFTFGEGLDAYLVETIFSGGVAMAIYNDRFFTPDYRDLEGLFPDSDSATRNIGGFIRVVDNEVRYQAIAKQQHAVVAKHYVQAEYVQNIKTFYDRYFLLPV
jgi:hypothetical protein